MGTNYYKNDLLLIKYVVTLVITSPGGSVGPVVDEAGVPSTVSTCLNAIPVNRCRGPELKTGKTTTLDLLSVKRFFI